MLKAIKIILFLFIAGSSGYVFTGNNNNECVNNSLCSKTEKEVQSYLKLMANEYFKGMYLDAAVMIWEKNIATLPNANWVVLNKDISRLYAAETIASAVRNRFIVYETSQLREFAQSQINTKRTDEVTKAIAILRIIDAEEDAVLIERVASKGNNAILEEAVKALSMMCNPNSKEAAFRVANMSEKKEFRRLLNSRVKALLNFKKQTNHCKPKTGYHIFTG